MIFIFITKSQISDDLFHPLSVMAAPVDLAAGIALLEMLDILAGAGFEQMLNVSFVHIHQQAIAGYATRKGLEMIDEAVPLNDLPQLNERVGGTCAVSTHDGFAFEQAAVAGEEDALLGDSLICEDPVGDVLVVNAIKTKHTQIGG